MAVLLTSTLGQRIGYGTLGHYATTGLTVAITVRFKTTPNTRRIVGQWDGANAWLCAMDGDEIVFLVRGTGGHYGLKTSAFNFVTEKTYRVVMKVGGIGGTQARACWVNGASATVVAFFDDALSAINSGAGDNLRIGDTDGVAPEHAEYSEFALWPYELSDANCREYGQGVPANMLGQKPKTYARLRDINDTHDLMRNVSATERAGANAKHPVMLERARTFRRHNLGRLATPTSLIRARGALVRRGGSFPARINRDGFGRTGSTLGGSWITAGSWQGLAVDFTTDGSSVIVPTSDGGAWLYRVPNESHDHYAEARLTLAAGNQVGLLVRSNGSNTFYYAVFSLAATEYRLFKCVAGTVTPILFTGGTYGDPAGKVFRLEIRGSTLTMTLDNKVIGRTTDSSIRVGKRAGIVGYDRGSLDEFKTGDVVLSHRRTVAVEVPVKHGGGIIRRASSSGCKNLSDVLDAARAGGIQINKDSPQAQDLIRWWPCRDNTQALRDLCRGDHLAGSGTTRTMRVTDRGRINDVGVAAPYFTAASPFKSGDGLNAGGTICAWKNNYYLDTGTQTLFSSLDWATFLDGIQLYCRSNIHSTLVVGSASTYQALDSVLTGTTNVTSHVAGTWGDGYLRVYKDGKVDVQVAQTVIPVTTVRAHRVAENAAGSSRPFAGSFDDIRIYCRPLTPQEMFRVYDPETRFDLYWKPRIMVAQTEVTPPSGGAFRRNAALSAGMR